LNQLTGLKTVFEQAPQVSPISDAAITRQKLLVLRHEHRKLDKEIKAASLNSVFDTFQIQRFKKRKLALKDEIQRLVSSCLPDIIA
jgi:hypothetical protein